MSRRRRKHTRRNPVAAEPPLTQSVGADTGVLIGVVACFVLSGFAADAALDVIETARRLIYIFNIEVDRVEEGVLEPVPGAFDLKLRQIDTVRAVVDEVRRSHDIPRYKTEQLDRALRDIISRLEAVR